VKASAFSYARATNVSNALQLLVTHGDKAKVLSGGQSLLSAMNLRLISPELIVDISQIAELRGLSMTGDTLRIGALTRHAEIARSSEIALVAPLLVEATAHVAHPAIRNKGTLGGSLAHADPASELPACMLALDATILIQGQAGQRRVKAKDFFRGLYETALSPQELLIAVELPVARSGASHFFREFARRHGDYALVGLAAQAIVERGLFADLRLAFFAVGDRPVVQGFGAALFEKCICDDRGQLTNASMADYLVPMAGEIPDIDLGHVVSPTFETEPGAKGAGKAGTAGVVANAVNDALRPFGVTITEIPLTPQVILTALGRA
jgi:aerobic carbon-monoxide dehydrogenase medium subunit